MALCPLVSTHSGRTSEHTHRACLRNMALFNADPKGEGREAAGRSTRRPPSFLPVTVPAPHAGLRVVAQFELRLIRRKRDVRKNGMVQPQADLRGGPNRTADAGVQGSLRTAGAILSSLSHEGSCLNLATASSGSGRSQGKRQTKAVVEPRAAHPMHGNILERVLVTDVPQSPCMATCLAASLSISVAKAGYEAQASRKRATR